MSPNEAFGDAVWVAKKKMSKEYERGVRGIRETL